MLMFSLNICGQNTGEKPNGPPLFHREHHLHFNFLGIADEMDRNLSFGAALAMNKIWSAGIDVAYIFDSKYLTESRLTRGVILRPFLRYYFDEDRSGFLEGNIHFKSVNYKLRDWLGKDIVNGFPSYEEYTSFHFKKRVIGLDMKIGRRFELSRNERLQMEVYVGIGYRYKKQGPDDGTYRRNRDLAFSLYEPEYSYASVPAGLRLTYQLNKTEARVKK